MNSRPKNRVATLSRRENNMYKNFVSLLFSVMLLVVPAVSAQLTDFEKSLFARPKSTSAKQAKPVSAKKKQSKPNSTNAKQSKPDSTSVKQSKPDSTNVKQLKPDSTNAKQSNPDSTSAMQLKPDSTNAGQSKMEEFEKSLAEAMPTGMSEVYVLREQLLESSKEGDTARVAKLITELEGRQTRKILPIKPFEKGFLYVENKMFNRLREHILHFYKTRYDTLELDPDYREAKEDGLELYVTTGIDKRDPSKNLYYVLAADIEKANMSPTEREELTLLMLLIDTYKDKETQKEIMNRANKFVEAHPDHPDAEWIKKSILFPLEHMNVREMFATERRALKEKTITDKLYTGGVGLNVFLFDGGFSGIDTEFEDKFVEPEDPFYFELYVQIMRFAVFFLNRPTGTDGMASADLGAGYVVYDSRYFKLRPFFAFSSPMTQLHAKENFSLYSAKGRAHYVSDNGFSPLSDDAKHYAAGEDIDELNDESVGYTLGVNFDFKFLTSFLFTSTTKLNSISVVGQFGLSYLDIDDAFNKESGVSGFFGIGLGVYFW